MDAELTADDKIDILENWGYRVEAIKNLNNTVTLRWYCARNRWKTNPVTFATLDEGVDIITERVNDTIWDVVNEL